MRFKEWLPNQGYLERELLGNQRLKKIQEKTRNLMKLRQFKEGFGSWWNDGKSKLRTFRKG